MNIFLLPVIILTWISYDTGVAKLTYLLKGQSVCWHVAYMHGHVSSLHALAQVGDFKRVTAKDCPQWPVSAPFYQPCPLLSLTTGTSFSGQTANLPPEGDTWSHGTPSRMAANPLGQPTGLWESGCARVCACMCMHACAGMLGGREVWGLGTQRQHICYVPGNCRVLGSGLGFHGNGQPPSAVCSSLD